MPRVGVLALQGDFAAHGKALDELSVEWQLVKTPYELAQVQGLIIPWGESTTLLKLMAPIAMRPALEQFHAEERPIWDLRRFDPLAADHSSTTGEPGLHQHCGRA